MVFTVNPAEAQAMQEDEAQLVAAIAQAARGVVVALQHAPGSAPKPSETLRIQMGRRLIYGQMANGQFRNELNADALKVIFDSVQQPVTPDVDPGQYKNKIPAIQINQGEDILFREERDGTVTVNQIQLQLTERVSTATAPISNQVQLNGHHPAPNIESIEVSNSPEAGSTQNREWQAKDIAQAAEYLLNPLAEEDPIYDAVEIQGYTISRAGNKISISRDNQSILVTQAGTVISDHSTQTDWQVFQQIQQRSIPRHTLDSSENSIFLNGSSSNQQEGAQALPGKETTETVLAAISIAEREATKLPEGETRKLLQSTTQNWRQQLLRTTQTGLKQGIGWLASRPEVWRNQQTARAALDLFNRGYERTGERSYRVGDYMLNFKGRNLYTLRDAKGELMRFQAFKSPLPGVSRQTIQVLAIADRLDGSRRQDLQTLQRDKAMTPQGDLDVEVNYVAKTHQVEQTVGEFLRNRVGANVWDKEGGKFKLEVGPAEFIRITDKQEGRGVVFQRQDGEVFSRLGAKDFAHFERLATRMHQAHTQSQARSQNRGVEMELG
ncbi:MAG: hypothetical protein F6K19_14800 [Cyanothece sp. SIO1E1]|nr:hypothetical protein [Cyanothece sp. SIO1E1]